MVDYDEIKIANKNDEEINPATEDTLETIMKELGFIPTITGYIYNTYNVMYGMQYLQGPPITNFPHMVNNNININEMYSYNVGQFTYGTVFGKLNFRAISGGYAMLGPTQSMSIKFKGRKIAVLGHKVPSTNGATKIVVDITDSSGDRHYEIPYDSEHCCDDYNKIFLYVDDLTDEEHTFTIKNPDTDDNRWILFGGVFVEKYKNITVDLAHSIDMIKMSFQFENFRLLTDIRNSLHISTDTALEYQVSGHSILSIKTPKQINIFRSYVNNTGTVDLKIYCNLRIGMFSVPPSEVKGNGYKLNDDYSITLHPGGVIFVEYKSYSDIIDFAVMNESDNEGSFNISYKAV